MNRSWGLDVVVLTGKIDCCTEFVSRYREKEFRTKLRLENLNTEGRKLLVQTCLDYKDIFYLPGGKLSYTDATRHTINVEPGTEPINTRPYKLPEMQIQKYANEEIVAGRDNRGKYFPVEYPDLSHTYEIGCEWTAKIQASCRL